MSELLKNARVIDSSGCHRYDYWHEQHLFDESPSTGWCSPSRSDGPGEFLVVDLHSTADVSKIRMLSRSINPKAGFPICFSVSGSTDRQTWSTLLSLKDCDSDVSTWHEWEIAQNNSTRFLRFDITDVGRRDDGKYFTQFMCLEVYAREGSVKERLPMTRVSSSKNLGIDDPSQPVKFGVHASPNQTVSIWKLRPGQQLPLHIHDVGEDTWVVVEGRGECYLLEQGAGFANAYCPDPNAVVIPPSKVDHDPVAGIPVEAGSVVVNPPSTYHGIRNTGSIDLVMVAVTGPGVLPCKYVPR